MLHSTSNRTSSECSFLRKEVYSMTIIHQTALIFHRPLLLGHGILRDTSHSVRFQTQMSLSILCSRATVSPWNYSQLTQPIQWLISLSVGSSALKAQNGHGVVSFFSSSGLWLCFLMKVFLPLGIDLQIHHLWGLKQQENEVNSRW